MAVKTLYLLDALVSGANHMALQDGGTAPAAATTATGWIVGTGIANPYATMDSNTERAEAAFGAADITAIDNTLGNCFRTQNKLNGHFLEGAWILDFPVVAVTSGGDQDGRVRVRLFKGSDPTGAGATEITAAAQVGSGVTNLAVGTPQTSSVTFILTSAAFFVGEYLFVLVNWERTGAGGAADRDVLLRVGSAAKITTSEFRFSGLVALTANLNRPINPDDSDVLDAQQNIFPQEVFAFKCTPRGFLVIPKVVRVGSRSSQWTRNGVWTDGVDAAIIEDGNTKLNGVTNSFVEITVRARAIRVIFNGDSNRGIATITIDGSAPSTISGVTMEDGSTALDTIDTFRVGRVERLFFGYKGLSNAAHTIRITVSGTKNASSTDFIIGVQGVEYVDTLCDSADGVACNQVFVLPSGDREDMVDPGDTAAITYVGTWSTVTNVKALKGQYRESSTAADYFEVTFTGTGIVLLFVGGSGQGFQDITVDAVLVAKRFTMYHPSVNHFFYAFPLLGLSSASHTVRVTVNAANEGGGNKLVSFAGFFVVKDTDADGLGGVLVTAERRWNKTSLDSVTMLAPDASNPRKDLLVINKSGVFSIIQGTAAAAPVEPAEPTDDRVPLAVLCQDKAGILLTNLHALEVQGVATESEDAVLRQVQDRRRGIVTPLGEIPIGSPARLPKRSKRVRLNVTRAMATDRAGVVVQGASPALTRDAEMPAGTNVPMFINVDGLAEKNVTIATTAGAPTTVQAVSVM